MTAELHDHTETAGECQRFVTRLTEVLKAQELPAGALEALLAVTSRRTDLGAHEKGSVRIVCHWVDDPAHLAVGDTTALNLAAVAGFSLALFDLDHSWPGFDSRDHTLRRVGPSDARALARRMKPGVSQRMKTGVRRLFGWA